MEKYLWYCVFSTKYGLLWKFRSLKHALEYAGWYKKKYNGNLWIEEEGKSSKKETEKKKN